MQDHLVKYLFDGLIPTASVLFVIFLFNLLYTVPHRIRAQASSLTPPKLSFIVPSQDICSLYPASCDSPVKTTPSDPRIALVKQAGTLSRQVGALYTHLQRKEDEIENQFRSDTAVFRPDDKYDLEHFSLSKQNRLHQAMVDEVDRYKGEFMEPALDIRHKIRHLIPDAHEPNDFDTPIGDEIYTNPYGMGLQSIAKDLAALAEALQSQIDSEKAVRGKTRG